MLLVEIFCALASGLLALYGLNSLYLVWLFRRLRRLRPAPSAPATWPSVTVQLPVFNEMHTVERLISAVSELDYPRDRLEVQVLDDSTDQTAALAAALVARARAAGLDIVHLRRGQRTGYKAGALQAGLAQARGEYLALFDADFVPSQDFLYRSLPWFADPRVGCVQARWGHLNRDYSSLTRQQALGIDGHFMVEQTARARGGLFLNFNGTAGVWRRACLEDAGGWQADTLTEDMDLSYRAQLRGWRIEFLPDLEVPAELPVQMAAYKGQQARWAQGSLQTARKLLWPLMRSAQPWRVKLEGMLHLTGYMVHPLILAAALLALPMNFSRSPILSWTPLLAAAALGPPLLYLAAEVPGGPGAGARLRSMPGLVLLGIGLALNNGCAALAGLLLPGRGRFVRTPKFAVHRAGERWQGSRYAVRRAPGMWGEAALAAITLAGALLAGARGNWGLAPWLALYAASFGYVALVTAWQAAGPAPAAPAARTRADIPSAARSPSPGD